MLNMTSFSFCYDVECCPVFGQVSLKISYYLLLCNNFMVFSAYFLIVYLLFYTKSHGISHIFLKEKR